MKPTLAILMLLALPALVAAPMPTMPPAIRHVVKAQSPKGASLVIGKPMLVVPPPRTVWVSVSPMPFNHNALQFWWLPNPNQTNYLFKLYATVKTNRLAFVATNKACLFAIREVDTNTGVLFQWATTK
jgi:hypothetical protein